MADLLSTVINTDQFHRIRRTKMMFGILAGAFGYKFQPVDPEKRVFRRLTASARLTFCELILEMEDGR
jgi:hypothetical protein